MIARRPEAGPGRRPLARGPLVAKTVTLHSLVMRFRCRLRAGCGDRPRPQAGGVVAPPLTLDRWRLPGCVAIMRRSNGDPAVRRRTARVRAAGRLRRGGAPPVAAVRAVARRPSAQGRRPPRARARAGRRLPAGGAVPRAGDAGSTRRAAGRVGAADLPAGTELRCWRGGGGDPGPRCRPRSPGRRCRTRRSSVASDRAAALAGRAPDPAPHVQVHRWAVPVRWFVLFDREERRLQLGPAGTDFGGFRSFGGGFGGGSAAVRRRPRRRPRR